MSKQETTGNSPSVYDLNKWIEKLKRCETIQEADVKALCNRAREILQEESNVQHVQSPVTVSTSNFDSTNTNHTPFRHLQICGDIHG